MGESQKRYLPGSNKNSKDTTLQVIQKLKNSGTDYEWYPTTDAMIDVVLQDVIATGETNRCCSVLDVGAGDGRVLQAFNINEDIGPCKCYGIEKAPEHVAKWDDITFIGGDFYEGGIGRKNVSLIFSNPPYLDFERWSEHLIKNSYAAVIYMVLPTRWVESERIQAALRLRGLVGKIIHTDDFSNADRKARAKINVVRIVHSVFDNEESRICRFRGTRWIKGSYSFSEFKDNDPMDLMFQEMFPNIAKVKKAKKNWDTWQEKNKRRERKVNDLVSSTNSIQGMVELYMGECDKILANYKKLDSLDIELFDELKIDIDTIKDTLNERMHNLRSEYWSALINYYEPITSRLTAKYRDKIYKEVIDEAKNLEFNITNALIVTQIVLKIADSFNVEQVKDFFLAITDPKALTQYKSNQKVFKREEWRYAKWQDEFIKGMRYTLDYRIVRHRAFNIDNERHDSGVFGLSNDQLYKTIKDLSVIAKIVGMPVAPTPILDRPASQVYRTGESCFAYYKKDDKEIELLKIKFFQNGNQHLFLNKEFSLRLNIFVGKNMGWVKSSEEAAEEMNVKHFNKNQVMSIFDDVVYKPITHDLKISNFLGYNG